MSWLQSGQYLVRCLHYRQVYFIKQKYILNQFSSFQESNGTRIYTKEKYREGALMIAELTGGGETGAAGTNQLVDVNCYAAFLCTNNEVVVDNLSCPALDTSSPVE